jgi:hypothetical protein
MTGFNFFSHGSQDLYPKMLEEAKGLSSALASKATIISNCGADKSTSVCDQGPADNITGRRNYRGLCIAIRRATTSVRLYGSTPNTSLTGSILICLLYTAAWIPLWIIPDSFSGLSAGAFFVQSGAHQTKPARGHAEAQVSRVPGASSRSTSARSLLLRSERPLAVSLTSSGTWHPPALVRAPDQPLITTRLTLRPN